MNFHKFHSGIFILFIKCALKVATLASYRVLSRVAFHTYIRIVWAYVALSVLDGPIFFLTSRCILCPRCYIQYNSVGKGLVLRHSIPHVLSIFQNIARWNLTTCFILLHNRRTLCLYIMTKMLIMS